MNDNRRVVSKSHISMRWLTRMLSIVICSVFLFFIILAVTNEDKPQGMAIPALVLLALTIACCFAAWRWEKVGGIVVAMAALCLSVVIYLASPASWLGLINFLLALIYGVPFLVAGILFWLCGQQAATDSTIITPLAFWLALLISGATIAGVVSAFFLGVTVGAS